MISIQQALQSWEENPLAFPQAVRDFVLEKFKELAPEREIEIKTEISRFAFHHPYGALRPVQLHQQDKRGKTLSVIITPYLSVLHEKISDVNINLYSFCGVERGTKDGRSTNIFIVYFAFKLGQMERNAYTAVRLEVYDPDAFTPPSATEIENELSAAVSESLKILDEYDELRTAFPLQQFQDVLFAKLAKVGADYLSPNPVSESFPPRSLLVSGPNPNDPIIYKLDIPVHFESPHPSKVAPRQHLIGLSFLFSKNELVIQLKPHAYSDRVVRIIRRKVAAGKITQLSVDAILNTQIIRRIARFAEEKLEVIAPSEAYYSIVKHHFPDLIPRITAEVAEECLKEILSTVCSNIEVVNVHLAYADKVLLAKTEVKEFYIVPAFDLKVGDEKVIRNVLAFNLIFVQYTSNPQKNEVTLKNISVSLPPLYIAEVLFPNASHKRYQVWLEQLESADTNKAVGIVDRTVVIEEQVEISCTDEESLRNGLRSTFNKAKTIILSNDTLLKLLLHILHFHISTLF